MFIKFNDVMCFTYLWQNSCSVFHEIVTEVVYGIYNLLLYVYTVYGRSVPTIVPYLIVLCPNAIESHPNRWSIDKWIKGVSFLRNCGDTSVAEYSR